MKKLLLVPFVCLISACSAPSVEDLMDDPELLSKSYQECIVKTAKGEEETETCKNVNEAQKKMGEALLKNLKKQMESHIK